MTALQKLDQYWSFLNSDPSNLPLRKDVADMAYQLGKFEDVVRLTEEGLALFPGDFFLRSISGLAYLALGQVKNARLIFQELLEDGQSDPAVLYNLAFCLMHEGDFKESVNLLADAESFYEAIPGMTHLKVRALHYLGNIDEAMQIADIGLARNPNDAVLLGMVANLYIDNADFIKAKQYGERSFNIDANNSDALTVLGTLALEDQNDVLALDYFNQATVVQSAGGRAWLGRGLAFMLQGAFDEAENSFRSAIQYMPAHLGTWQALTWCQIVNKKPEQARATIQQALDIDDNFADSHGVLAVIQLIMGESEQADISVKRALRLDKSCFSGLYARSLILSHNGRIDKAEDLIQSILKTPVFSGERTLGDVLSVYTAKRGKVSVD